MATFQGMSANTGFKNQLQGLLTNPSSFQADPGYQFARDQALQATQRANSKMAGSGNVLAALMDRASGLASQAFDTRVGELSNLAGQENQYDLGLGQNFNASQANANNATRNANDFTLGTVQNQNTATRNANDFALGSGQLGLGFYNDANNYALGLGENANTAQRNAYDYSLGIGQNANNAQRNAYDYSLGQGQNATNFYNAQTNRGAAQSNSFLGGQGNTLDWTKLYYSLYPRQRIAGVP